MLTTAFEISLKSFVTSITGPNLYLPFCLFPIFKTFFFNNGASIKPLEELPIIQSNKTKAFKNNFWPKEGI